jgi:hypothetical protein
MDGRVDDAGVAVGAGLGCVEIRTARAVDSVEGGSRAAKVTNADHLICSRRLTSVTHFIRYASGIESLDFLPSSTRDPMPQLRGPFRGHARPFHIPVEEKA